MKYAHVLLSLSLAGSIFAACSAATTNPGTSTTGAGAGGGQAGGGGVPTGTGGTTASSSSSSGAGAGGSTSSSSSSSSSSTSGGGSTSSSSSSSGAVDPFDFDAGWQMPDSGDAPPLIGDGGTGVVFGSGADPGAPGKFGGPASGGAISVVYPASGVILPPNMNSLEIHFIPAPGQTLFEITFHAPTTHLKVYTGCTPLGNGCVYATDDAFWTGLVPYARGAAPVTWTIRGVNASAPGAVGSSAQQKMTFTEQALLGGLYYWNTAGTGTVQRYDFGVPNLPAQIYMNGFTAGAAFCVGCHVMSRDGERIAVGKDIPSPAPYQVFKVQNKVPLYGSNGQPLAGQANFMSFAPNNQLLLISDGISINLVNLLAGAPVNGALVYPGTMPDWSPDGQHMVYAKPQSPAFFPMPGVSSASIMSAHWNGGGWDPPQTLVPFTGQNNYYPAFSPDGQWVAFNRSPGNAESFSNASPDPDAGTVPDGELWAVKAGGGAPIRLGAASDPGALAWPKWAPVQNDYHAGKIMWLTFSSARAYGLRLAKGQKTQLWMVGFDPARAAAGQDPSVAAFWLPFQDIGGGNHIAQWTTKVIRNKCTKTSDCDQGEICFNGDCKPG